MLWGLLPLKATCGVPDSSSSLLLAGTRLWWDSSVHGGCSLWERGAGSVSRSPTHVPEKEEEQGTWATGRGWMTVQ